MMDRIQSTVKIATGRLRGVRRDGLVAFLGVPYAAAPVGQRRFSLPVPHESWEGVRDATHHGPTAPQLIRPFTAFDPFPLAGSGWERGDDFLTANVWTPDPAAKGLAVMVYVHGGSWMTGSNNLLVTDGSAFARSGVVCISINYRLGAEGFLPIQGVPTNLGIRDVLAALQWVQKNVSFFGGDPRRVTLFGQSAGAMLVANLMSSPLSNGLFQRAIVQSGHGSMVRSVDVAERTVALLAKRLRIPPDEQGFRSCSMERCVQALDDMMQPDVVIDFSDADGRDPIYGLSPVSPIFGDDVLPARPLIALENGMGREVDLLIGTDREEMNLYYVPTGAREDMDESSVRMLLGPSHPEAATVLRSYGLGDEGKIPGDVLCEAMSDLVFRAPARQFALAHKGRSHMYEFGWRSPACNGDLGACHSIELPFVFNTLDCCAGPSGFVGQDPPGNLAERIHRLWVSFAKDGELPWPAYSTERRTVFSLEQTPRTDGQ